MARPYAVIVSQSIYTWNTDSGEGGDAPGYGGRIGRLQGSHSDIGWGQSDLHLDDYRGVIQI